MATYKAPLRDMRFVLYELHNGTALPEFPGLEDMTPELLDQVLEEAAKICEEVLHPLNRSGDEEGCRLENGVVREMGAPAKIIADYKAAMQAEEEAQAAGAT